MTQTPRLDLPLLAAAQAQKHVTHNEALLGLDALTQLSVLGVQSAPPFGAGEGARVIVGPNANGAFAGKEGWVARLQDGAWLLSQPRSGWRAWDESARALLVFSDGAWRLVPAAVNPAEMVGINASASASQRLVVRSDGALFTQDGAGSGDMRVTINKRASSATASVLFQTDYSGRIEIGATGDDALSVKASGDGVIWSSLLTASLSGVAVAVPLSVAASATIQGGLRVEGALGVGRHPSGSGGIFVHRTDAPFLIFSSGNSSAPVELGRIRTSANYLSLSGPGGSAHYLCARTDQSRVGVMTASPVHVLSVQGAAGPQTDNAFALGSASFRWSTAYVASGVISTSDARLKTDVGDCPLGLDFVRALRPCAYRWREGERVLAAAPAQDEAIDRPPVSTVRPGKRLHLGFLAQDVRAQLEGAGLDCALWTLADAADPDSRQGLRYEELFAPLVAAVQELARRVETLEAGAPVAQPPARC